MRGHGQIEHQWLRRCMFGPKLLKVTELESSHSDDLDFTNRIDGTNSFLNLVHMPSGVIRKKHVCYERNQTERNWFFIESLHVRSGR